MTQTAAAITPAQRRVDASKVRSDKALVPVIMKHFRYEMEGGTEVKLIAMKSKGSVPDSSPVLYYVYAKIHNVRAEETTFIYRYESDEFQYANRHYERIKAFDKKRSEKYEAAREALQAIYRQIPNPDNLGETTGGTLF